MNTKSTYFSCYTWLAFQINQSYYGGLHYTWCTPYFDPQSKFCEENAVPPTSSPKEIYWNLKREIDARDRHSAKIQQNKAGLQRGAEVNKRQGIISQREYKEILEITAVAEVSDFRPLIYLIPAQHVQHLIAPVAVKDKAHVMSEEYIIAKLPRGLFNVIEL